MGQFRGRSVLAFRYASLLSPPIPATAYALTLYATPPEKLGRPLTILTLLLFGCTTDKYDIFKIDASDKIFVLDFNETNDIRTFNKKFWKADSADNEFTFIVRFDFKKGDFADDSDYGIKIEGLPFSCLTHDCTNNNRLKLYLSDKYEILNNDLEKLNERETRNLVKANILNYGQDPTLSDNPEEAVTEVFLNFDQEINKTGHVLRIITDSYIELVESKKNETGQAIEELTIKFPLRIYLRQKMFASDLTPTINVEEIPEEIEIDTVALKEK